MAAIRQLLVVDDDHAFCRLFVSAAQAVGYEARAASTVEEFKSAYEGMNPEVIALDLSIPGTDGIELLRFLADRQCKAHILIVSGHGSRVLEAAQRLGEARGLSMGGVLSKPMRLVELQAALDRLGREA